MTQEEFDKHVDAIYDKYFHKLKYYTKKGDNEKVGELVEKRSEELLEVICESHKNEEENECMGR